MSPAKEIGGDRGQWAQQDSTCNPGIIRPADAGVKGGEDKGLRLHEPVLTPALRSELPTDLARLLASWNALPQHIRAAVLALVITAWK